jgi:tetratricopeptide (TPR) repeat protein
MKTINMYRPIFHILLIILVCLLAYSNTFLVPFLFDDHYYIVNNARIKDVSNIPSFFTEIEGPKATNPFTLTTFALNYYLSGLNTLGYHIFNVALHTINGILLYFLILITAGLLNYTAKHVRLIALFASLIFIAHPIQTECVTNIVGRSTPLITAFSLSGILLFVRAATAKKGRAFYIVGLFLSSLLGMASSEKFVTFPFMLILYDFFFVSKYKVKSVIKNYRIHVPVLVILGYFAYLVLSYEYEDISSGLKQATPLEYLMTQFNVHWTYLRLLVLPVNQNIDYDYPIARNLFEVPTIFSFIGYMGLWAWGISLWRRKPVISYGILWFMITLSPVSSIIPLKNMLFEHRLYLPAIGIFVTAVIAVFVVMEKLKDRWKAIDKTVLTVLAVIVIMLVGATYARNMVWKDEITLWKDVIKKTPRKARGYIFLGIVYQSQGLIDKAVEQYRIAIRLEPNSPEPYNNLGNLYLYRGQHDKAIEQYLIAIKLKPNFPELHYNLGNVYNSQGLFDKAIEQYLIAIRLKPDWDMPHLLLGRVYLKQGKKEAAHRQFKEVLQINPRHQGARNLINLILASP